MRIRRAVVRAATEQDLLALLALYAHLHPDDPDLADENATLVFRQIAAQAGHTILLALLGDDAVGTVACIVVPNLTRDGRPHMLIENVVVRDDARRRGVATELIESALSLARAAGCYKVQLLSRADRVEAHAFCQSRGFRTVAQGYRLYFP